LEDIEPYGVAKPLDLETEGRKISRIQDTTSFPPFKIKRYHLDTNEHVNNSQYIQMALEVVPEEIQMKKVRVEYKKSALYGDTVIPKIARDKSRTVVELSNEQGQPYALVEVR
jgi:acyl-ACP thioesterase